jgi:RNA polymerase-binding transcription factor
VVTPANKTDSKVAAAGPKKAPAKKPAVEAVKTAPKPGAGKVAAVEAKKAPAKKPTVKSVDIPAAKAAGRKAPAGPILAEAEVLKMSDKDYMNEAQLIFFKAKLLAMKEEILANARETGEHLKENEVFADPNDRATVEEENMLEQRVRDRERKLLKKIDSALTRIESGDYGYCLETGEPIGIPRLLARPTAELSIEAQEKHERMERLYAD